MIDAHDDDLVSHHRQASAVHPIIQSSVESRFFLIRQKKKNMVDLPHVCVQESKKKRGVLRGSSETEVLDDFFGLCGGFGDKLYVVKEKRWITPHNIDNGL